MDQQFWPQIGSSFQDVVLRSQGFYFLALVVFAVAVACLVYYLKKRLDRKKQQEAHKFFEVISSREIREIFEAAIEHNSRFDVRLSGQRREILCLLKEYDRSHVYLEPPSQIRLPERIAGREVSVYFKVKSHNGRMSFYKFQSRITAVSDRVEYQILSLDMPQSLEMEQKRQHLRLEDATEYLLRLEIRKVSHDARGNFHRDIREFGEVLWSGEPAGNRPFVMLLDISGGGIRLKVAAPKLGMDKDFFKINPQLLVSVFLSDEPGSVADAQWFHLIGRVRKHYYDGFGSYIIGLQHEYRALLDEGGENIMGWEAVRAVDGVEDLASWVVKVHLRMFREKGLKSR